MQRATANLALLVALSVIWGTAFLFITLGLRDFSPLLFAAFRVDIAGVIVLNDPVEPRMIVAFAMIVVSFILVTENWRRRRATPSPAPRGMRPLANLEMEPPPSSNPHAAAAA